MAKRISKDYLDETVKTNTFLNTSAIVLLNSYGFTVDKDKKRVTIKERDEILELLEKLENLEALRLKGFTPKECGELIKLGLYESLCVCIANGYRIPEYKALKRSIGKSGEKEAKQKTEKQEKGLNSKKITAAYSGVVKAGDLSPEEMKIMLKMCGYKVQGKLVQEELTAEEESEKTI